MHSTLSVFDSILGMERHGAAEFSAIERNMKVIYRGLGSMICLRFPFGSESMQRFDLFFLK
jgi:hypothetical protein